MAQLSLLSGYSVQQNLAEYLRQRRKAGKMSRDDLAQRSTVPASTIKKFETTGQISLRQLLLLWQSLDDLSRIQTLLEPQRRLTHLPATIDEVLKG
ncbi:transcriptional regulator [Pantoea dispersa]|uniref:transcriptional regulator n=1 Tax=Pantoea dispersa TaxID=59814 RepID=UPI002DB89F80|nr:transcriptional regulator [Pantoea dispersa]MEB5973931.1 helix-turn-helix domain-containing protein [Pantoea dispersa]